MWKLILARILPRIRQVDQFRLVLMSATMNVEDFMKRVLDSGIPRDDVGTFLMHERTNPLALHCLPQELLRDRDNIELALRMIIKIHHEYRDGYHGEPRSKKGPILVFVPGKAEIRLLTEMIKNAVNRGYTCGLFPYGFHSDTPDKDRDFLTASEDDPDISRYGELTEVRNQVLDQLGIEEGLRAYAMEHLWLNNMVGTDGQLTKLGRFAADVEPTDPEKRSVAVVWTSFQCPSGSSCYLHHPDKGQFAHQSKGQDFVPPPRWGFSYHDQHLECCGMDSSADSTP